VIYLDTSASYPLIPEVKDVLASAFESSYANSAANHLLAEQANKLIESARVRLADSIGAYPSEIVFTSGATESNNTAFKGVLLGGKTLPAKTHIITTQIEHKCVFSICDYLSGLGFEITYLQPDSDGIVDAAAVENALQKNTAFVSVMHVNNELGSINPLAEIGALCRGKGIFLHSDAAQSFGKLSIDIDECNVDSLSISAHKIGGPKGIGALYVRDLRKLKLEPVIHGAGQEEGLRGGTVATPLIMGFGEAAKYFPNHYAAFKLTNAKGYLLEKLSTHSVPYKVNGGKYSLPSCISLTLPKTNVARLIRESEDSLCLAQGSACSSKEIEASHVLTAMGLTRNLADKTLRISFPLDISIEQLDSLVAAIGFSTNNEKA
jgi:cysteine desulfurase